MQRQFVTITYSMEFRGRLAVHMNLPVQRSEKCEIVVGVARIMLNPGVDDRRPEPFLRAPRSSCSHGNSPLSARQCETAAVL
jgi:hypothetical protein